MLRTSQPQKTFTGPYIKKSVFDPQHSYKQGSYSYNSVYANDADNNTNSDRSIAKEKDQMKP